MPSTCKTQTHDDEGVHADDIGAAHRILDVAEQSARIGDEMRQVLAPAGAEQVDAEGGQMPFQHVELCVDHVQQQGRLIGQADERPADRQRGDAEQGEHDQAEAPGARQRHDTRQPARAGIEQRCEQDPGEQEKQARRVLPDERQSRGHAEDDQRRGKRATPAHLFRFAHRRG